MDLKTFNPNGVGVDNGAYYGLPFTPEEAALVLVSAPWDVTDPTVPERLWRRMP